jgi:hypothetical protein
VQYIFEFDALRSGAAVEEVCGGAWVERKKGKCSKPDQATPEPKGKRGNCCSECKGIFKVEAYNTSRHFLGGSSVLLGDVPTGN